MPIASDDHGMGHPRLRAFEDVASDVQTPHSEHLRSPLRNRPDSRASAPSGWRNVQTNCCEWLRQSSSGAAISPVG